MLGGASSPGLVNELSFKHGAFYTCCERNSKPQARPSALKYLPPLLSKRFLDTILLCTIILAVQRDRAANQKIPIGAMLDDEVEFRNLLEIMLNAPYPTIGAVFDNGLPTLFFVKGYYVVHSYSIAARHPGCMADRKSVQP